MKTLKKIKYLEIKNLLEKNSLDINSQISDSEIFTNIKSILNSSQNDLSFFANNKYLNQLKKTKAKACLIEEKFIQYLPTTPDDATFFILPLLEQLSIITFVHNLPIIPAE